MEMVEDNGEAHEKQTLSYYRIEGEYDNRDISLILPQELLFQIGFLTPTLGISSIFGSCDGGL